MATPPDSTPKRRLLSLPQELLDIILDFAYPAEDEKSFIDRKNFEKQERERRRRNPSTFAPKDFTHKVDQWMVSRAFFESATRAWVANQHFRGYPFSGQHTTPFALVHHMACRAPNSILVLYCTKLSVFYIPVYSEFDALPSLKYLTLSIDHELFESSEPAFPWEVALSPEQLKTVSRKSGLSELPKLKQIKLVAQSVRYAKTQTQQRQWLSNVAALEMLLQEQQKFKVAKATDVSKLPTRSRVPHILRKLATKNSTVLPGKIEPISSDRGLVQGGPDAALTEVQKPETTAGAAKSQTKKEAKKASLSKSKARKSQDLVTSLQNSKSGTSEAQKAASRVKHTSYLRDTAILAPPNDELGFRIKGSAKAHQETTTTRGKATGVKDGDSKPVVEELAKETPSEASSGKKRDAEKFYLPPRKRRALVKRDLLANEKPTRRLKKSISRPALKGERLALLSPAMTAPLHGATQEATLSQTINAFLFEGTSKTAQTGGKIPEVEHSAKAHHRALMEETTVPESTRKDTDEEPSGPPKMASTSTKPEMKSIMPEHSASEDFIAGDHVVSSRNALDNIIGHSKTTTTLTDAKTLTQGTQTKSESDQAETATAKLTRSDVLSQGTQTDSESDQTYTPTAKLTESGVFSSGTQTKLELDPAEEITTKHTEVKVCSQTTQTDSELDQVEKTTTMLTQPDIPSQSTQVEPEPDRAEKITTKFAEAKISSQGTQTEPEFDEGEIVAKLKQLEQAVSSLLALHSEPKPAAKASVLLVMCSIVCFLLCLWVFMKMALSNDYVAFHLLGLEAQYLG